MIGAIRKCLARDIKAHASRGGVESTARDAYDMGYNVTLVRDAITDTDAAAHDTAIRRIFPRLGDVTTSEEIVGALKRR